MILLNVASLCFLFPALLVSFAASAPAPIELSKRNSALFDLWNPIPGKIGGNRAEMFKIDTGNPSAYALTYMYGCLGIVLSSPNVVVLGHLQEENAGCVNLADNSAVQAYIEKLRAATDLIENTAELEADFLITSYGQIAKGTFTIKDFLRDELDIQTITDRIYTANSGTGEPDPNSPNGLAVAQWIPGDTSIGGTLNIYFNKEDPVNRYPK